MPSTSVDEIGFELVDDDADGVLEVDEARLGVPGRVVAAELARPDAPGAGRFSPAALIVAVEGLLARGDPVAAGPDGDRAHAEPGLHRRRGQGIRPGGKLAREQFAAHCDVHLPHPLPPVPEPAEVS
jgi:hypothetical protein